MRSREYSEQLFFVSYLPIMLMKLFSRCGCTKYTMLKKGASKFFCCEEVKMKKIRP